jgi:hypothetical protein
MSEQATPLYSNVIAQALNNANNLLEAAQFNLNQATFGDTSENVEIQADLQIGADATLAVAQAYVNAYTGLVAALTAL